MSMHSSPVPAKAPANPAVGRTCLCFSNASWSLVCALRIHDSVVARDVEPSPRFCWDRLSPGCKFCSPLAAAAAFLQRAVALTVDPVRRAERALAAAKDPPHPDSARENLRWVWQRFAERSRRELIATGGKVRKRSVETRGQLTPQEEQIARLARDGLSNPEIGAQLFLSARTVEWHLRKVFTKLGIGSRRELGAVLGCLGQDG
jgi:DNA-binding CsgD family transcriptional regulator